MKTKTSLLLFFLITAWVVQPQVLAADSRAELLVKWKDGPNSAAAAAGNTQIGSSVRRNFDTLGWQLVDLPTGVSASDGIKAYRSLAAVALVEPNGKLRIVRPLPPSPAAEMKVPDDPLYGSQWYLPRIGAPAAWEVTTGSSNVVVAIIDTGVDYNHPDLAPNMWRNPGETGLDAQGHDKVSNGIDDDNNGYVDDVYGINAADGTGDPMDVGFWFSPNYTNKIYSGTHMAGIIGGAGNNALGITGVNWSVRMMAVAVNGGDLAEFNLDHVKSDSLAAWDYVVKMKRRGTNIRVISSSGGDYQESFAIRDAIIAAGAEGILNVFASGLDSLNEDLFAAFPAEFTVPSIISVTACTASDTLADFANFGLSTVDICAPGVNMFSTWKDGTYRGGLGGACPIVAGAAALLLAVKPTLSVDELKAALYGSVDQPPALQGKVVTHGRLNVARAIQYLTNENPAAIVITSFPAGQRTTTNAPIEVTFNRPMNRLSVESAFSIQPAVDGVFEWSSDGRSLVFHHAAPFDSSTNYAVRISGAAQDDTGQSLDGNFNRRLEGSPADDYLWTFRFPIPNDDFVNAQVLTGNTGALQSSNRYSSCEPTEPDHVADRTSTSSLWYRWTPPGSDEWFTFDLTGGTSFDSLLAIYTGQQLDSLNAIDGNDNYDNSTNSRVSFLAKAGTQYFIAIAGKSQDSSKSYVTKDQTGPFTFRWYPTPPPGFTGTQFSPTSGAAGSTITLTGTNFTGATAVLFNSASAAFSNAPTNNVDLRIIATVPPDAISGPITIKTPHGTVTSAAVFEVPPPRVSMRLTPAKDVEISWPAGVGAFVVESSTDLRAHAWTAVLEPPILADGQWVLRIPASAQDARFYRLRRK